MYRKGNDNVKIELYTSSNTHPCKSGTDNFETPTGILKTKEKHAELVLHLFLPSLATSLLIQFCIFD